MTQTVCAKCLVYYKYDERYDSYFCKDCNEWASKKCDEYSCFFCRDRPEKPIEEKKESNEESISF